MIDDKKIEEAIEDYVKYSSVEDEYPGTEGKAFKAGAEWAINEFLKDLFHPASEVPRNDNGMVLAFSKVFGNRKLYNMNAMLDETTCNTYQEMWEEQVYMFQLSDWIFVDELFDMIMKGGDHD